eukprot:CAMPEP_0206222720 /NCGR_PEP_ID=MMETSP0047_2-20121206/6105_1 /ASSEMBLY_ACC=CAM_ASM_000192 /TAXON_ID=195065 /ORGANISM="Chroomonas mesostigmatica_cf, Strain CCMP1168" /LENGTH=107 /DNA_ID=CAMNT_0053645553 /DNA_START=1364 /DNA_END=1684 /DNA_ORIENTATION=-
MTTRSGTTTRSISTPPSSFSRTTSLITRSGRMLPLVLLAVVLLGVTVALAGPLGSGVAPLRLLLRVGRSTMIAEARGMIPEAGALRGGAAALDDAALYSEDGSGDAR